MSSTRALRSPSRDGARRAAASTAPSAATSAEPSTGVGAAVGPVAVPGLLAPNHPPGSASPVIRRLVGFEVELSVPTYHRYGTTALDRVRGGPVPSPAVRTVFGGGVSYKTPLGSVRTAAGRSISMTADHNETAGIGQKLFDDIGVVDPTATRDAEYVELSNLEYGTDPLDELGPGSDRTYRDLADAIDAHAQRIFALSPTTALSDLPDANGFQSGLPDADVKQWLNRGRTTDVVRSYKMLKDSIRWHMYIQATVGILPSGLRAVYASQAAGLPGEPDDPAFDAAVAVKDAASAVARLSQTLAASPAITAIGLAAPSQNALVGVLTMAASHAVGNAMYHTTAVSDSEKNSVQLLNKLGANSLTSMAFNRGLLTHFQGQAQDQTVKKEIRRFAELIHALPQTTVDYWTGRGARRVQRATPLYGSGRATPKAATEQLLADWLTGRDTVTVVSAGADGQLPRPDPAPAAIAGKRSGHQQGIPLEMRWITEFPDGPGQLWPVFKSVLDEVRAANLDHLKPQDRAAILAQTR